MISKPSTQRLRSSPRKSFRYGFKFGIVNVIITFLAKYVAVDEFYA